MKKYFILLLLVLVFSCNKKQEATPVNTNPALQPPLPSSKILLLKVDYLTHAFEGGKVLNLSQAIVTSDSIPVKVQYQPPGDFGDITLSHKLTGDSLFYGGIIWMGKGVMTFPAQLDSSATFVQLGNPVGQPSASRFQLIFNQSPAPNISSLWSSINKLKTVKEYLIFNKKIGLFCYTPSVGMGNPADWDWFIFLSN